MSELIKIVVEKAPWLALILLLIGAGWQVWVFQQNQAASLDNATLEARKPFLEKQLDFCIEATHAAAQLATTQEPATWAAAYVTFYEYYYGKLSIVEEVDRGSPLATRMDSFRTELVKLKANKSEMLAERGDLGSRAIYIAHGCRDLVRANWDIGGISRRVQAR